MSRFKYFLLFLVVTLFIGCNSFYDHYAEEDLYRVPLISPYRLTQIYGFTESDGLEWFLDLYYAGDTTHMGYDQISVREINLVNGVIYGHKSAGRIDTNHYYFVIIPSQKIEAVFRDKIQWESYLEQRKVDPSKMYAVWPVFKEFKEQGTLPWYNPSKKICPTSSFKQ